jgi:hypothetical protein
MELLGTLSNPLPELSNPLAEVQIRVTLGGEYSVSSVCGGRCPWLRK